MAMSINTMVLFVVGVVMGVVVTLSIMSHMSMGGTDVVHGGAQVGGGHVGSAQKRANDKVQAKKRNAAATTAAAATSTTGASTNSGPAVSVGADLESWATDIAAKMSRPFTSLSRQEQQAPSAASASTNVDTDSPTSRHSSSSSSDSSSSASVKPSFYNGYAGLEKEGEAVGAITPRKGVQGRAQAQGSKKKMVVESPLDAIAKTIKWEPGARKQQRQQAREDATTSTSTPPTGPEPAKAVIRDNNDAVHTFLDQHESQRIIPSKNHDRKTDLRGRLIDDDVIEGRGQKLVKDSTHRSGSGAGAAATAAATTSSSGVAAAPGLSHAWYHNQATALPAPVVVPSLDLYTQQGRQPLPDMSQQKAVFEPENLKIHLCNAVFEAYSASYLTTRQHMMAVKSESYNLTWVNCEMASFIHMRESKNFLKNPTADGMIMQSLDVLDFSVIHLSAFERSSKKWKNKLWTDKKDLKTAWHNIDPVKKTAEILDNLNNPKNPKSRPIVYTPEAQKTVVIMPFLGGAMGAGHSELGNRFEYLKACFWSFYEFVPNIVAGVSRQEDVDWGMKESGLPFYDMILIEGMPKSASLPVATTQHVKQKLVSGEWKFDYIFFTESDQILISRTLPLMHDHLKKYPDRMILPHRLMPYSDRVIQEVHGRDIKAISRSLAPTAASADTADAAGAEHRQHGIGPNDWMTQSCCMPRQNCVERKSWRPIADSAVPVVNYHGLYVPLGNVNFLAESYRYCEMSEYKDICP